MLWLTRPASRVRAATVARGWARAGHSGRPSQVLELVLVRHGESEGNIAYRRSIEGDHSLYSGQFLQRHSSLWRLTEKGKEQAVQAGAWVQEKGLDPDAFFSSEYIRAMETASLMGLPAAQWRIETHLRERDWGRWDLASQAERRRLYKSEEARRKRHGFYFSPPGCARR